MTMIRYCFPLLTLNTVHGLRHVKATVSVRQARNIICGEIYALLHPRRLINSLKYCAITIDV